MTEDKEKIYLSSLNKIIKSGSPKYLSYISKEYMRNKDINPQIALAISCMIQKEATDEGSVYAIFLDSNGTINLEAMSDISKITNLNEFINNVEKLAEFNIDFSDLTADELIIEGEQIAEELAREAERLEQEIEGIDVDENTDVSQIESIIDSKSSEVLTKVGVFVGISAAFAGIIVRIKSVFLRVTSILSGKKSEKKIIKNENHKNNENKENKILNANEKDKDDSFCPKINIDIGKVVNQTERNNAEKERIKEENKRKGITTDEDIDDNPADDFLDF